MKSRMNIKCLALVVLGLALYHQTVAQSQLLTFDADFSTKSSRISVERHWTVDPVHSKVKFTVTHLVISEVDGSFNVYSGKINTSQEDFSDAKIEFSVDAASINTENMDRDTHLKSEDFFFVEKYPKLTFQST